MQRYNQLDCNYEERTQHLSKKKEDNDDKYNRMKEKIIFMVKRMTMLEDPNSRGSEMKTNDTE